MDLKACVPKELIGMRLDAALPRLFPGVFPSRASAAAALAAGRIRAPRGQKPSRALEDGEEVAYCPPGAVPSDHPSLGDGACLDILFEDGCLAFVNKPPGLCVHPGAGTRAATLADHLAARWGSLPSPSGGHRGGIVHRLDKDTSGVLVVAKTPHAHTALAAQFASHTQTREYLAVVRGRPQVLRGTLETWHGRHPQHRTRFACVPQDKGKRAVMSYEVLRSWEGPKGPVASLVRCRLATGRTHQIRVQLQSLGHAVLGDAVYGSPLGPLPGAPRQLLHALHLGITHPGTGEPMGWSAPVPGDFAAACTALDHAYCEIDI